MKLFKKIFNSKQSVIPFSDEEVIQNELELFGIDRPNMTKLASIIYNDRSPGSVQLHGIGQGEGKTTLCAKIVYEMVKLKSSPLSKYFSLYVIPMNQLQDFYDNQYLPVEKLCIENKNPIIYIKTKKPKPLLTYIDKKFIELQSKYDFTICTNYKQLAALLNNVRYENAVVLGATTSQLLYYQADSIIPLLCENQTDLYVDEADTFIGVTTAMNYARDEENPAVAFQGKFLNKVIYPILKNKKAQINAFTGTPTAEQRGAFLNTETTIFKYFEYESDESTKKPVESIIFLNGLAQDTLTGVFNPDWGIRSTIAGINLAVAERQYQNKRSNSTDGVSIVKIGVGKMKSLIEGGYKEFNTNMENVLFICSDTQIGVSKLTKSGFQKIGKNSIDCKALIEDPKTPYNIIVNIRVCARGFDMPDIDSVFDLSGSAKTREQYAYSQNLGRGNRFCGTKTTRYYLRMREGTKSGLLYYINQSYNDGSYDSNKLKEMISSELCVSFNTLTAKYA